MSAPESQGVDSGRLDAALKQLEAQTDVDGISQTMVIRNGYVLRRGPYTDSWHNIYSCTKSFLSITAGLLADDGKLSLDTRLCELLPEMKQYYPELTVRHCLSMTHGYAAVDAAHPFTPAPPLFAPGSTFYYYNTGMDILAYGMTRIAGEPLSQLFTRRIADPVGLGERWLWGDYGLVNGVRVNNGAGGYFKGIHTTAENISRIGLLLLNKGCWNGTRLLSADWIAEASRPQSSAEIPLYDTEGWYKTIHGAYGLGFWVNGTRSDGKRLWPDAPANTFALQGHLNNICIVIPDWNMILTRLGTGSLHGAGRYNDVFVLLKDALNY